MCYSCEQMEAGAGLYELAMENGQIRAEQADEDFENSIWRTKDGQEIPLDEMKTSQEKYKSTPGYQKAATPRA